MSKTVLITGSSTGIGKAAASYFHDKGWNVAATMRTPSKEQELSPGPRLIKPALDVTDKASIEAAIATTEATFGPIDVFVNNAGFGLSGSFESITDEQIRRQFDTNVFGLMDAVRAILPRFRERKAGVLINVASMGGRVTFPLYSVYHASKWAVDGFSESLQFELEQVGVRVKIIEPGAIKTDFYERSAEFQHDESLQEYNAYVKKANRKMKKAGNSGAAPEAVAKAIYQAATDDSVRLRYPVGSDAKSMLFLRRLVPDRVYQAIIKKAIA